MSTGRPACLYQWREHETPVQCTLPEGHASDLAGYTRHVNGDRYSVESPHDYLVRTGEPVVLAGAEPTDAAATAARVAIGIAGMGEALAPVLDATEGYRATLEQQGYSDGLARKMAADYHAAILRFVIPGGPH